jgi:GNAT superfamily N-acetyltransferase
MDITGYQPGDIGLMTALHADYYSREWGFGLYFEAKVAGEMAEFLGRLDPERDLFLCARLQGELAGGVAVDGSAEDIPRLRWFIVNSTAQGQGVGRRLLGQAVDFCRQAGHQSLYLWTFRGLEAARVLYEEAGFRLEEETPARQWGEEVMEQRYLLDLTT